MRLFTAIELSQDILLRLERLLSALRPEALIKWSPLDNLHITTKFIGEWPEPRLNELDECLSTLDPRVPFDVAVRDLGWFPNERSPRVLWAGVHDGEPLQKLAHDTEEAVAKLGIARENRPFSAHLTLARIKNPVPLGRLRDKVTELQPAPLGSFTVTHFALFRSYPGSNASIYRKLREYKFESALAAS
ncbi:MAG: RNA 2',3'-cyclic phosphodiesterase [Acidobacteriaceae bacterium]|nr:RNA 2',3'-cyclic phosphodiesterase [Acidobacteriaceae bacterium]